MKKNKTPKKSKAAPKKKKDLTKLVKVKVRIKTGKKAGQFVIRWKKRADIKPEDVVEKKDEEKKEEARPEPEQKKKFEPKKTLDLRAYDLESSEPVISDLRQDKSLMSPFYYQVPFVQDGKRLWKLYPNAGAYHRDFPNGPQEGHLLVNQAHPDHLEVNPKAIFAKVGKKKFKTAEEFLKYVNVPTPAELKLMFRGKDDSEKKGFKGIIEPDFHHIEWQPGSKVFNANQRFWMGVQNAYTNYREPMQMKYDRERFARAGVPWTEKDYQIRKQIVDQHGLGLTGAEQQAKASGAKKRKERLFSNPKANNPIKNIAELERIQTTGDIKKGTSVKFILNGKVMTGKVVHAGAFNADGVALKNKAATHFKVAYNTAQNTANKGGVMREVILTRDKLERTDTKAYKRKPKKEVAEAQEQRKKESEERTLENAKARLGARTDVEFQKRVLDIMGGEHGLESAQNPINKFLERKIEDIVGAWGASGTLQTMRGPDGKLYVSDMTHADLLHAARVGVYNAVLNYDPKKGKLIQFIGSDTTKHFIKEALKDALAIERGRTDTLSQEGRTLIAHLKESEQMFIGINERKPTTQELIETFQHSYPELHKKNAERRAYTLEDLVTHMRRSKAANYMSDENGGEIDLLDQVHSPFKTPEEVAIEKVQMGEFRKNLYRTLKDSYEKSGHKNPEKQALLASHAMQLHHRVDESTTGYGTFGEESPYSKEATPAQAAAYEKQYAGKATTSGAKLEGKRSMAQVGQILGKKPEAIQNLIADATSRVRNQFEAGHQAAVDLKRQFFGKSYQQTSDEIKSYMLKSLFPEKRDIYAEKQWSKAHEMARAIFLAA